MPCCEANTLAFETGFDEEFLMQELTSVWMCGICHCLPRRPVYIDGCPHLFCEACLMEHFRVSRDPNEPRDAQEEEEQRYVVPLAPCPNCKRDFSKSEICPFEHMDPWVQRAFKERQVKCPFKCGFVGDMVEVDTHQVYTCPRRPLQCPHKDCDVVVEAAVLERDHFPTCPKRRVHCAHCKLAVLASEEDTHDCVKRLQSALTSM